MLIFWYCDIIFYNHLQLSTKEKAHLLFYILQISNDCWIKSKHFSHTLFKRIISIESNWLTFYLYRYRSDGLNKIFKIISQSPVHYLLNKAYLKYSNRCKSPRLNRTEPFEMCINDIFSIKTSYIRRWPLTYPKRSRFNWQHKFEQVSISVLWKDLVSNDFKNH